jgi:hypothetical protein
MFKAGSAVLLFSYFFAAPLAASDAEAYEDFQNFEEAVDIIEDLSIPTELPQIVHVANSSSLGHASLSPVLRKSRQSAECSKQEAIAIDEAFKEIDLNSIFTDEVMFDLEKIAEKKQKLEELSITLDKSERRMEDVQSEMIRWLVSTEMDESHETFAEYYYKATREDEFMIMQLYNIKRKIVHEYIHFLDFLSQIYGNYEREGDYGFVCNDLNDVITWNAHMDVIKSLLKEEEDFVASIQQHIKK